MLEASLLAFPYLSLAYWAVVAAEHLHAIAMGAAGLAPCGHSKVFIFTSLLFFWSLLRL